MNVNIKESLIIIFLIAMVTFGTRIIPFLLFPDTQKRPTYVVYLGKALPLAIMGMLIVYCLKGVSISAFPFGIPEGMAIALVVGLHRWKGNTLMSILGGTVLYMILVQLVFR